MPLLDVWDILTDPDFQDSFQVISKTRSITSGLAIDGVSPPVARQGVVIPNMSSTIRLEDGTRMADSIEVYTQTPLTAGYKRDNVNSTGADIVVWHGRQFVVKAVNDFMSFGQGFVHASCDLVTDYVTAGP